MRFAVGIERIVNRWDITLRGGKYLNIHSVFVEYCVSKEDVGGINMLSFEYKKMTQR